MIKLLITANLLITGFMTGLIWFVQVVHYPIFSKVPAEDFTRFHLAHTRLTGNVVALPMLAELFLAFALLFFSLEGWQWANWLAFGLVLFLWVITFFWFMPVHGRLSTGANPEIIQKLVSVNWWRTFAWTFRLLLLTLLIWEVS